ncbi:MAG: SUMF1/EgtB/PvdO family nonheme iron enzyme, partial [Cellvibrionaceae bacterium]|nr:SUMF1/EgtB/PvdO family nonheme iron enzyme [Cellvibrionaceae bacterium]
LQASAPGYHPLTLAFELGEQTLELPVSLKKLPGSVQLQLREQGGAPLRQAEQLRIQLIGASNSEAGANTLLENIEAGPYQLQLKHPLYQDYLAPIDVTGLGQLQQQTIELSPNYGLLNITASDEGAGISLNGKALGEPPMSVALAPGEHEISLSKGGFKSHSEWRELSPRSEQTLQFAPLQAADALLALGSYPSGAGVTVNGQYRGETPIELALEPGRQYQLRLYQAGFKRHSKSVQLAKGEQQQLHIKLNAELGQVEVQASPAGAKILVDGKLVKAGQRLQLPARPTRIQVSAAGYVSQSRSITPSPKRPQNLSFKLQTEAQAKLAKLKPSITAPDGQTLKLMRPKAELTLGSSRRQQGRRANEAQWPASIGRLFYVGSKEVSNAQYRQFDPKHSSKHSKRVSLDNDNHPVVNISWQQAASYCNWLSDKAGLPRFYNSSGDGISGFNPKASGYRLLTELEWAWLARWQGGKMKKYAWGEKLQAGQAKANYGGNYADRSAAAQVGVILSNYSDGYAVSAPVGSFAADAHGLYDISGNAAEWLHDFYQIHSGLSQKTRVDSYGPSKGKYHVVRGPNWTSGSISELRLAFRDYGKDGKRHIGFRIARNAL